MSGVGGERASSPFCLAARPCADRGSASSVRSPAYREGPSAERRRLDGRTLDWRASLPCIGSFCNTEAGVVTYIFPAVVPIEAHQNRCACAYVRIHDTRADVTIQRKINVIHTQDKREAAHAHA